MPFMKVLFLSSWFPSRVAPLNGDFVERHALAVSTVCDTAVLHVISDERKKQDGYEVWVEKKHQLLEVILYFRKCNCTLKPAARFCNAWRYLWGYLKGYQYIRRLWGKPDVVHANILYPIVIVAWFLKRFAGIPFIVSEHWTLFLTASPAVPNGWFVRRMAATASFLSPVSANLQQALIRHGFRGNFTVVPNVVDTQFFKPGTGVLPGQPVRLLHVSSMKEEQKNIIGIIRTLHKLSKHRNDFVFTFAGPGLPHQQQLVSDLGIAPGTVNFTGEVTHAAVAELMQQSHALVLFSRTENLPCVIAEAFSCGLPVISSDVGGISEWVNDSNGILVPSEDEDRLLQALVYIIEHLTGYRHDVLRQYAETHFSPGVIAGRFAELYKLAVNS